MKSKTDKSDVHKLVPVPVDLKSDSHVSENFCQIEIFPNLVGTNTIICMFGV